MILCSKEAIVAGERFQECLDACNACAAACLARGSEFAAAACRLCADICTDIRWGTATCQLHRSGGRHAVCAMCIGVGQGIAVVIERV